MGVSGVILAAGRGTRFGGAGNKVWEPLAGRPVLGHAIEAFSSSGVVDEIVVVIRAEDEPRLASLCIRDLPLRVVRGGKLRADSARAGLTAARGTHVLIHDGARALVTPDLIAQTLEATKLHGAAVPVVAVSDTVRYAREGWLHREAIARADLVQIQTPQGFTRDLLLRAYAEAERQGLALNDDAAAVLALGHPVATVPGDPANLKITRREDLRLAERILAGSR